MASHEMFLAMVLANARRAEASCVILTVDGDQPRIDMLLLDGSSRGLTAPPADVLLRIIDTLDGGQREFSSSVFVATVETVNVLRGAGGARARIAAWTMAHSE